MVQYSGIPTFLPVTNSQQQLVAICPDFGSLESAVIFDTLQDWKSREFFEKLSSVQWLIGCPDLQGIPCDIHTRLPAAKIVLCIPEVLCGDLENQVRLRHFLANGFRVVADQFASPLNLIWSETKHIAIDCKDGVPFYSKSWTQKLSSGIHWAKNLSSALEYEQAFSAGFKLFSGSYPYRPPSTNRTADGSARSRLLKLLGLVARDADSWELEDLFRQDTVLSFMLFKLVSSAAFAQTVKVSSFGQAINLLGRRQLQRWLQLLLYARQQDQPGALNPLMPRAAFRASMMEALCQKFGGSKDELDAAFMIGMFSLLDKLFDSELKDVLQPLNLDEKILSALLNRTGLLGACLNFVEIADLSRTEEFESQISKLELDAGSYYECVLHAYSWVNQVCRDM